MRRFGVFFFRAIIIVVQWLCGEWLRKTIRFPIFWIVLNVGCNSVQFVCVPDNMVMKSGLPRKWNVVQVGISGNGGFDAADTHGQPSLLCGHGPHSDITCVVCWFDRPIFLFFGQ